MPRPDEPGRRRRPALPDVSADAADLVHLLTDRGLTIATAESLTGGLLAATLIDVPGASAVVTGGVVAYATPVKHSVLGVDAGLLDERGPVDPEVAEQMADRVRLVCAVDGRARRPRPRDDRRGRARPAGRPPARHRVRRGGVGTRHPLGRARRSTGIGLRCVGRPSPR